MLMLTGAAGFVGRHFPAAVTGFMRSDSLLCVDKAPRPEWVTPLHNYLRCDLTDVNSVEPIIADFKPSTIVHLAAQSEVGHSSDVNVIMLEVLTAALRRHVRSDYKPHLIVAGSAAEYGMLHDNDEPPTENSKLRPIDPYAVSKAICSDMALKFGALASCPVTVTRFSNIYGPHQINRLVPYVLDAAIAGRPITLAGKGLPKRQFVFINDVCAALWAIVKDKSATGVFNIGANPEYTTVQVAQAVVTAVHDYQLLHGMMPIPTVFDLLPEGGGAMRVAVNFARAIYKLKWTPRIDFYAGVKRTVAQAMGDLYAGQGGDRSAAGGAADRA